MASLTVDTQKKTLSQKLERCIGVRFVRSGLRKSSRHHDRASPGPRNALQKLLFNAAPHYAIEALDRLECFENQVTAFSK